MTDVEAHVRANLAAVRERIARACQRCGRDPQDVRLLAVSKRHPAEAIRAAHAAGQREFGENYVQELVSKASELQDLTDLRMRFIGHLQRNKAKELVRVGCTVDTIDSVRVAEAISRRVLDAGRGEDPIEVLLEINVDREPQKGGVMPADAPALAYQVARLPGLSLRGVMAIPRVQEDPDAMRPAFRRLRELGQSLQLPVLSMGMSADLEVAVEEGSTMVRVGTAIFGERPTGHSE